MFQTNTLRERPPKAILQILFKHPPVKEQVDIGHIVFQKDDRICSLDFQKWELYYDGNALVIKTYDCDIQGFDFTYEDLQHAIVTDLFLQGEEDVAIPDGQGIVDMTLTLLDHATNTPIIRFTRKELRNTDLGEYYDFVS